MNNDSTLEWVVFGGALISFLYHFVMYIQQKDRYLLLYSNYLFSLTIYLLFRRITNYDSFEYSTDRIAFAFDYPLILYMLISYAYFISLILDIHNDAKILKFAAYGIYGSASIFFIDHIYKLIFTNEAYLTREYFLISKMIMVTFAFIGFSRAWYIRKTIFVRLILSGGIIYVLFGFLTIISVYYNKPIFGLKQYDLYFIGSLLDILMFSSALGYRTHLINVEKIHNQEELTNQSLKNEELLHEQKLLLEKENKQRQALIDLNKNIQQELGSRLSSIHVYTALASKEIYKDASKSQQLLDKASILSTQLMTDMGDILWIASLSESVHIAEIKAKIHTLAQELMGSKEINYEIVFSNRFNDISLNKNIIGEIIAIFKTEILRLKESDYFWTISFDISQSIQKNIITCDIIKQN